MSNQYIQLLLFVFLCMVCFTRKCESVRLDCCQSKYSSTGLGCETDTNVGNDTYYCVAVAESCSTCTNAANISSFSCYQCCAKDSGACGLPFSYISTSSWSKF